MTDYLEEWREATTYEHEFPSGLKARLKRLALIDLVGMGQVPDTLSGLVAEAIRKEELPTEEVDLEEMQHSVEVINLVCMACFVEPKLTPEPTEESLGVYDVPFEWRSDVFRWANSAAEELKPFRRQPARAAEAA
jgi:hypothetical protein